MTATADPSPAAAPARAARPLRLLALETSTETLSVAVTADGRLRLHEAAGGAQASAGLLPAALTLLAEAGLRVGDLDAIVFGRGPGAFTGVRTACAVAQGLGFGAGRPLLPVDTLLAVAEDARLRHGATRVMAALDARMGEVYMACWVLETATPEPTWRCIAPAQLLRPADLRPADGGMLAGNIAGLPGLAAGLVWPAMPRADALLRLAPALLARGAAVCAPEALPLYVRDRVALTTRERDEARAAAAQNADPRHPSRTLNAAPNPDR